MLTHTTPSLLHADTLTPSPLHNFQFIADLISWAVVGERTCASRAHRELASGLSTPVGFVKDSVRDSIRGGERVALDAVRASGAPHAFLSVSKQGVAGIVETTGNKDCHVVLPAESLHSLNEECSALTTLELPSRVMVKCAASPGKQYSQSAQLQSVNDVASLIRTGNQAKVLGVLLPSFLLTGRQDLQKATPAANGNGHSGGSPLGKGNKVGGLYGMSVTEPCLDWSSTAQALESLAAAVREARVNGEAKKQRVA